MTDWSYTFLPFFCVGLRQRTLHYHADWKCPVWGNFSISFLIYRKDNNSVSVWWWNVSLADSMLIFSLIFWGPGQEPTPKQWPPAFNTTKAETGRPGERRLEGGGNSLRCMVTVRSDSFTGDHPLTLFPRNGQKSLWSKIGRALLMGDLYR
jgi:hypothetical protein